MASSAGAVAVAMAGVVVVVVPRSVPECEYADRPASTVKDDNSICASKNDD